MRRPGPDSATRTLFVMVLVTVALVVVQEMSARLGAHTGEGLISLVREQFSLRMGAFAVALLVANLGLVVSEFAGIGAAMEIFGVSRYIPSHRCRRHLRGGRARVVQATPSGSSSALLVFLAYPVAMVLAHPDWGQVATNAVWPHVVWTKDFLFLAVALIGTTITPVHAALPGGRRRRPGDRARRVPRGGIDAVSGALFADVSSCRS